MLFYAACVVGHPAMQNPTIVVLTDRNDLDEQLFGQFHRCYKILGQTPVQAETGDHLCKFRTSHFVSLAIFLVLNRSISRASSESGCTEYYRYPRFCVPNRAKLASKKVSHMEVASSAIRLEGVNSKLGFHQYENLHETCDPSNSGYLPHPDQSSPFSRSRSDRFSRGPFLAQWDQAERASGTCRTTHHLC
jgi:hypothetical protein